MPPKALILAASILTCSCTASVGPNTQAGAPDLSMASSARLTFMYNGNDFSEAKIRVEQSHSAAGLGNVVEEGFAPEHVCFDLKDSRPLPAFEQGPRYFFPARSFVCAIPLEESSAKDFDEAYPGLSIAAVDLQKILRERPENFEDPREVPDIPAKNAGPSIFSRFQYLGFRSGSGILFLTQYSQEIEPNPVNNEELTLVFQGLTDDGRYYLAARLAINHPSLPRGIDFTDHIDRDSNSSYLTRAEAELEGVPEESFWPSLKSLKALLSSIYIE
jgi:hypothetical protein